MATKKSASSKAAGTKTGAAAQKTATDKAPATEKSAAKKAPATKVAAKKTAGAGSAAVVEPVKAAGGKAAGKAHPSQHDIAVRAYLLWERDGKKHGHQDHYWKQAEHELMSF